jgi:cytochrome c5
VHLPKLIFFRRVALFISPVLILGIAILGTPLQSLAQAGSAAPDTGPTAATTASPSQPKPAVELPEGDGKAIATEYCQDCHKLTNLTKARKNPDDWHDTVQTMMDRGARLPQEKFDTLVQYLAKNFGPQPAVPAAGVGSPEASPAGSSPSNR